MKRNAAAFVAVWMILSAVSVILIFNLNLTTDIKMTQFICMNASVLIGLCAFFTFNRNKISLLLGNYKREKEI